MQMANEPDTPWVPVTLDSKCSDPVTWSVLDALSGQLSPCDGSWNQLMASYTFTGPAERVSQSHISCVELRLTHLAWVMRPALTIALEVRWKLLTGRWVACLPLIPGIGHLHSRHSQRVGVGTVVPTGTG